MTEGLRTPRPAWVGALGAAAAALAVLVWFSPLFEPWRLDLVTLNDQAGYVTTARWLVDTGEFRSHIIYPAYVETPNWRLYMPGYYWCLAAAFEVLGYGPLQARLPGMLGFVVTAACVFLIGRKLYGARPGAIAVALLILFPPALAYPYTAMSEPLWLAAGTLAMCVFLHLPARIGPWAAPWLLALPFLFRETGALLLLPMLCLLRSRPRSNLGALALAGAGSVVVLQGLGSWQRATGRISPPVSWIPRGEFNIGDAMFVRSPPTYDLGQWVSGFAGNIWSNLGRIIGRWWSADLFTLEPLFTGTLLALSLYALLLGLRRKDAFALGVGLLGVSLFATVIVFHRAVIQVVIRHVLITAPLLAVVVAPGLDRWLAARPARRLRRTGITALALLVASHVGSLAIARQIVGDTPKDTLTLEAAGHDDSTLLVTPASVGLDYAIKHYPVRWSFVPDNDETLRLLDETHQIGTLVVKRWDLGRKISPGVLQELRLYPHPEQFEKINGALTFQRQR